jgi:hypothetical protein
MRCPVPGQQNTVVSSQGIPAVIAFTFRERNGNPMNLSRWFKKKCQQLPEDTLLTVDAVMTEEPLPYDELVELPQVEINDHCNECEENA